MHQVLKASGISQAIMQDRMLFFPALKIADKHKATCMTYSLFWIWLSSISSTGILVWQIKWPIFSCSLVVLRNVVLFPYTYEISSHLLWCENICYSVNNTCYLTLRLRWVLVFTSWTIKLHLAPPVSWRQCMHVQAVNREISTYETGGANDMFFTVIYTGA